MKELRVDITNWPKPNRMEKYVPIAIAILALAVSVSVYSAYFTRTSFVVAQRPYVWATNYGFLDQNKRIQPVPQKIAFRVTNSPARVLRQEVTIFYEQRKLFYSLVQDTVQFPDERSEWTFTIGNEEYSKMHSDAGEQSPLVRSVIIHYSSLDGGKLYKFELRQTFDRAINQWRDVTRTAT